MDSNDLKRMGKERRKFLAVPKTRRFKNRKKEASRKACRGYNAGEDA